MAVLVLAAAAPAFAQQNAGALKQRILTHAQSLSPDDYAFTRTIRSETTSDGRTEKKVTVEKFDPIKPADSRWTLASVNGAPPSADEMAAHRKEAAKRRIVPGYHRVAAYFGSPATATESGGKTMFQFASLPKGAISVLDTDVSHNASAEVSVSEAGATPFAEQVRFTVKPMRVKLLMKIDRFETTARYRIGPDGRPLLTESTSDMTGSGLGREGTMRNATTYSDYRKVR